MNETNVPKMRKAKSVKAAYIPKDLNDCFQRLQTVMRPEVIAELKSTAEKDICRYHHGLGAGLRNDWGLWRDSILKQYFNKLGIWHADDMSGIIIKSFWRHLNGLPIKLEEQIEYYQKYWKAKHINMGEIR